MIGTAHAMDVGAARIAWGELGAGPPLVLLHGVLDTHRTWRRLAPLLAEDFRLLLPDLPGHGLSSRPDAPYSLAWNARVLLRWMEAIGLDRAHVCGHSYGGGVAQWMLLEGRHRVNRLALVSPGGLGREVSVGMKLATVPVLGQLLAPLAVRYGMSVALRLGRAIFGDQEPEEIARAVSLSRIPGSGRAFQRTLAGVIDIRGQYRQTVQRAHEVGELPPVALFWGEDDPILPVAHGRAALELSESISLVTYPTCGHFPQLEVPADLAADLRHFLRDPTRQPARNYPAGPRPAQEVPA
jgi:pimeloyl-ACP methyl ester carboxylesterase